MPSISKLTSSMFPEVYETLLRTLNPRMPEATWQRAFVDRGWSKEDHFGYVLTDSGRVVGMLGTLYSERDIAGQAAKFCNLHCWIVQPEYRASSLLLMRPVLARKDLTLTDLSATEGVVAISRRLGFSSLGRTLVVLPPILPFRKNQDVELVHLQPNSQELAELSAADRRIFRDHQDIDCGHLLVKTPEGNCYVVSSRVRSCMLSHSHIHYISNPGVFAHCNAAIRRQLITGGTKYAAIDERLLGGETIPFALRLRTNEKLFRPAGVPAAAVDSLYTEMPLFKLPALTRPSLKIRQTARRLLGFGRRAAV